MCTCGHKLSDHYSLYENLTNNVCRECDCDKYKKVEHV